MVSPLKPPIESESRRYGLLIACHAWALGLLQIVAGSQKLMGAPRMVAEFHAFDLPHWMLIYIGTAETIAGLALLWNPTRLPALFASCMLLTWGVVATWTAKMAPLAWLPTVLLILTGFVTWQQSLTDSINYRRQQN
ncbi:DoxX family membrane protein [Ottowia sp.]|uniref:DoxX family membrane protein n=1 Tax=Ottowia sp. TaxID=1898956 RepID=UPI002D04A5B2|nr:DoxX family membrane protein [Ottowia sp.]HPZ56077.1 hypothetical protein [Ottowia sp.]HQD48626.1 hypothetical protein [Ottowia sp.]